MSGQTDMFVYEHKVQYYETDGMQIVHHSNYLRWMEEARTDFLAKAGVPYEMIEAKGLLIPVLSASCEYKQAARFGETVKIFAEMGKFSGVRFSVFYRITNEDASVVHATGTTTHCFLTRDMKPVKLKKAAPDVYEALFGEQPDSENRR